ncbi:MAG: D-arabinono-1,4-lactone oxidase [Acidimicrobiales bacterium]
MRIVRPGSEADFVAALDLAGNQGWAVRAVGASHSHSRVAAVDGLLVETDGWQGIVEPGPEHPAEGRPEVDGSPLVTVRSGTRIFQLGEPLYQLGLGLINQGDIDKQSIAGAISTGTHGTGPTLANFSNAVAGVRLVLAGGDVISCSADHEPDLFAVARHSLGAVGLVTEVELRVRPRYRLHERQWVATIDDVMPRVSDLIEATRHFEFFWVPDRDLFACKSLTELPELPGQGSGVDRSVDRDAAGSGPSSPEAEVISKRERIGWSHRIISSIRDDKHTEMEYAVPAESGPACFAELREMIHTRFPDLTWPLEYRTVAADDLMISAASARPTVTISAHQDISLDDRPLFTACEEIFRRYDGRPHWGKVHYQTGEELAELYPSYRSWWELRDRFDPDGRFVTTDLARLRP